MPALIMKSSSMAVLFCKPVISGKVDKNFTVMMCCSLSAQKIIR